jgi:hypothetical protein
MHLVCSLPYLILRCTVTLTLNPQTDVTLTSRLGKTAALYPFPFSRLVAIFVKVVPNLFIPVICLALLQDHVRCEFTKCHNKNCHNEQQKTHHYGPAISKLH